MTERPILFSPPMVQAILDGRKLQTRRTIKPQPTAEYFKIGGSYPPHQVSCNADDAQYTFLRSPKNGRAVFVSDAAKIYNGTGSPYGKPGDILWVREMFTTIPYYGIVKNPQYVFFDQVTNPEQHKWKPSIHMPKDAARIWLEVTDVRVERLQDISEDDAVLEGVEWDHPFARPEDCSDLVRSQHWINSFMVLWLSITGADFWNLNPWVWVVSFKVLSTTGKAGIERKEVVV